ncbi:MAG: MMPL family transporter [Actinomycetota bacterium]|nr:MMPL family transporter [Actinomycetota bacterium]
MSESAVLTVPQPEPAEVRRPGPLGRLAGVAYRRRGRVLLGWVAALALAFGLSSLFSGAFSADYVSPGSDSKAALQLLEQRFPAAAGASIDVVVHSDAPVTDPAVKQQVAGLLRKLDAGRHVSGVTDPYTTPGSISPDGHTLLATARLDVTNYEDMPIADTKHLMALAHDTQQPGTQIALGGQAVQKAEQGAIGSEGIGLIAAAIILLIMFGSVVAAGLPIMVAVAGLGVSSLLTGVIAAAMPVPDWSTSLAAMMGIGIGIDYALLMVTRFREWRAEGLDAEAATIATLDTAGRSVLLAGSTVIISMFGLFAMGLSFMRGAASVTIVGVFIVMLASVTLFPALLGFFGTRIDRLRLPLPRRRRAAAAAATPAGPGELSARWLRWSRLVERHRVIGVLAGVAVLVALATPFFGVTFGFPDAGNDPAGSSNRQAYEMTGQAFGVGANGPLLLVAQLPAGAGPAALTALTNDLAATKGLAAVSPPRLNPAGDTAVLSLIPTTGPQDRATIRLVHHLRDDVIPASTAKTGATAHMGGVTATSVDSTNNVVSRLPLLIGGVVGLSMLLLLIAFRSIAVAVKAAVMNLFSVGAAYGVVALVMQGGWFGRLFGVDTRTPVPAFIPVLMFAVLFGLSMDYEVFLVARMREAWLRTKDNSSAIVSGLAGTARVITAAAAVMIAVFAAFIPSELIFLKVIGIGMAAAIFIDATIVRMLLVPAVMHLLGAANWWMPSGLGRFLPQLHVEGRPELHRQPA